MKILVLDNYDSFTYNLVQYLREITGQGLDVYRNDAIRLEEVEKYDLIVLSPGPGLPKDAGIMPHLIRCYAATKSILGVCLGMQAIGEAFGAQLVNLKQVCHGIATEAQVVDNQEFMFDSLPKRLMVGRYHSWVVAASDLPDSLVITAVDESARIMALRHIEYHVKGVQFHPESVMTAHGKQMLTNFLVEAELRRHQLKQRAKRQAQR